MKLRAFCMAMLMAVSLTGCGCQSKNAANGTDQPTATDPTYEADGSGTVSEETASPNGTTNNRTNTNGTTSDRVDANNNTTSSDQTTNTGDPVTDVTNGAANAGESVIEGTEDVIDGAANAVDDAANGARNIMDGRMRSDTRTTTGNR